jgi:uncharacterized protein YndB with AHSA1/START domain
MKQSGTVPRSRCSVLRAARRFWKDRTLVTPTITTVEIDRPPEVVFPYVIDPGTFPAWQPAVLEGALDREVGVGAICTTTRKIGGGAREVHSRITEYAPPHRWADHGIDGPIRGIVSVDVMPLDAGARSHVTITVDFEGHGIGKVLVPLVVRRKAAEEMPSNVSRLKAALESS